MYGFWQRPQPGVKCGFAWTIPIRTERLSMKEMSLDCLTERHLLLFGLIIQWFARYELLIQDVMATVSGSDLASVMLLIRDLDFSGKRRALLELLRHWTIPLNQFDRISDYLMVPHTLTPLRNNIAHSVWIASSPPDSIQPDWILRRLRALSRCVMIRARRVTSSSNLTKRKSPARSIA
jgi:hypothetical protein